MTDSSPESLFASVLAHREAGQEVDLEALCRAHPEHAEELRQLDEQWRRLDDIRHRFQPSASKTEILQEHADTDIDPRVRLDGDDSDDFTERLIGQLSDRTPASIRYQTRGEVGRGGFGSVLRVWDEDLRRHLAMKVLLPKRRHSKQGDTTPVHKRHLARFRFLQLGGSITQIRMRS